MMKKNFIIILLSIFTSCSRSNKNYNIIDPLAFVEKNGDYSGFVVNDKDFFVFTNQYKNANDYKINLFKTSLNKPLENYKLLKQFVGTSVYIYNQDDNNNIIFGIGDVIKYKTYVYEYDNSTFTQIFTTDKNILWFNKKENLFYDGHDVFKLIGMKAISITKEFGDNNSYQIFNKNIYKLSQKNDKMQLDEYSIDLKFKRTIFNTSRDLSFIFKILNNGEIILIEKNKEIYNLIKFNNGIFSNLKNNIGEFDDDFYVYKNFVAIFSTELNEDMLNGFGGTTHKLMYSNNSGLKFNEFEINNELLLRPYNFIRDDMFICNLGNGKILKLELKPRTYSAKSNSGVDK